MTHRAASLKKCKEHGCYVIFQMNATQLKRTIQPNSEQKNKWSRKYMTNKHDARRAILAAADHLESNPHALRPLAGIPGDLNAHGSVSGWIAYFAGYTNPERNDSLVQFEVLGYNNANAFHFGMEKAQRWIGWRGWFGMWSTHGRIAARTLRVYADVYHPAYPATEAPATPMEPVKQTVM